MNFNEYQKMVQEVRLPSADPEYAILGLAGEVGEFYSILAKERRDGGSTALDFINHIKKELGDCLWFLAAIAHDYGFTLEDCAELNAIKLRDRQARGKLQGSGDER